MVICSSIFWGNRSVLPKNEQMSNIAQKNERFAHSLLVSDLSNLLMVANFWFGTWANRSFLVSDLSNLLISLTKKEGMSELLIF